MQPDMPRAFDKNDLRALSDPLDYSDPMVTRSVPNITYQLDDVASLAPGTYNVYVYHLPKAGKIPGLAAPTGIGPNGVASLPPTRSSVFSWSTLRSFA